MVYNLGLDEFLAGMGKSRKRVSPRQPWPPGASRWKPAGWVPFPSILRITAVRKLAVEVADNGLLAPGANGITRVKGVASKGVSALGTGSLCPAGPGPAERAGRHRQ
jgi:hypothetical protein